MLKFVLQEINVKLSEGNAFSRTMAPSVPVALCRLAEGEAKVIPLSHDRHLLWAVTHRPRHYRQRPRPSQTKGSKFDFLLQRPVPYCRDPKTRQYIRKDGDDTAFNLPGTGHPILSIGFP
jgi:hypothetical protein